MIALPELPPCAPGLVHQFRRERHDIDLALMQQQVELAPALVALPRFDYNRSLQGVDRRYQAHRIAGDGIDEAFGPRLLQQNRNNGRRVDHHLDYAGKPCSSKPMISSGLRLSWSGKAAHRSLMARSSSVRRGARRRPVSRFSCSRRAFTTASVID